MPVYLRILEVSCFSLILSLYAPSVLSDGIYNKSNLSYNYLSTSSLQLEVFINGVSTKLVASVKINSDETVTMPAEQLAGVGLKPGSAAATNDIILDLLPNLTYRIDHASQTIHFEVEDSSRLAQKIRYTQNNKENIKYDHNLGANLNYSIFNNISGNKNFNSIEYQGLSASFDGRVFSKFGLLESGLVVTSSPTEFYKTARLASRWIYSDPQNMLVYSVGDFITGGLSWTRSARLGGAQIRRNFSLRSDLVTMPLPELTGTAAVPSTVEVYTNNIRRFSSEVNSGPFEVTGIPFSSGSGTVQLVVKDQFGREKVEEFPFYASSRLLAKGLLDFSVEGGFPRSNFGLSDDKYDQRFFGSTSLRYGYSRRLTFEGHLEGGADLINGGAAALYNLGNIGIVSANAATSYAKGASGYRIGGSFEGSLYKWRFFASTQRVLGQYNDIGSFTAEPNHELSFLTFQLPRSIDQFTISAPTFKDGASLNFNLVRLKDFDEHTSTVFGVSYSRPFIGQSTFYANGYADITNKNTYGFFVGLTVPLNKGSASTGIESTETGVRSLADYSYPLEQKPWSIGGRLQGSEGKLSERQASLAVRTPIATVEAVGRHYDQGTSGSLQVSGGVALAGEGVFLSEQIHDSFAVVDVGAANIPVTVHNRYVGRTGQNGKLLVPHLISNQKNIIEIDPSDLPIDIDVPKTRAEVRPAEKNGIVVKFGVKKENDTAMVAFVLTSGEAVPVGSEGKLEGSDASFIIGYDGQAYIHNLKRNNIVDIVLYDQQDGATNCQAAFSFSPMKGVQQNLQNVVCK